MNYIEFNFALYTLNDSGGLDYLLPFQTEQAAIEFIGEQKNGQKYIVLKVYRSYSLSVV